VVLERDEDVTAFLRMLEASSRQIDINETHTKLFEQSMKHTFVATVSPNCATPG